MTKQYDENKPLYGSLGIDIYLKLIEQKYSFIDIEKLLKYAGMELYQVKDEGHLFSQKQINRFYEYLVKRTGNRHIAREAGRFGSSPEALGTMRRSLLGLLNPSKYYEIIGKYTNKISKATHYEANQLGPNKVEIIATPYEGTKEEPYQCENRMGYWEALSSLYNLKPPTIEHPECLFKNGNACRYIVSWEKSPASRFKSIRNYIFFCLILICLAGPVVLHNLTPSWPTLFVFTTLLSVSVSVMLYINWHLKRMEQAVLLNTIDDLRGSSDDLMDQVAINYENSLLVNEIGQTLAKEADIEGIFSKVIKVLHHRLDYDRALVMLSNNDRSRLIYQAASGYTEKQLDRLKEISFHLDSPESHGIFKVSYQTRKPQLLNDLEDVKKDLSPRSYEFAKKMKVKSMICCPIVYEDESLGILAVDNIKSKRPLLQRDLNLLMGIALQIGSRIHNIQLESHLRQVQKMEAVGNLAGGIAHDFNNILTTILGYSQMVSIKLAPEDPMRKMVDSIHNAGIKASSLTHQLLAFSRKQVLEMKVSNLNIIVEDMNSMLTRLIGEDILLKTFLAKPIGNIMADSSQIGQILMNLVVNARDAMPNGGRLTIETGDIFLDEKYAANLSYVTPGAYSMLSVTDTGKGMSPELREKIFEPFFTTKQLGKGTGLGLSTVYGIVKQHHGYIHVYSELGHGTSFKIYLPVVSGKVQEKETSMEISMAKGTETILVVDDDESIRSLILDTLKPLGYNTLEAQSGNDALQLHQTAKNHIDLVLSDVIMPGMNGRELVEKLSEEQPDLKAILMSGYTDNVISHHGVLESGYILINKPLFPIALANKIREVLDMGSPVQVTMQKTGKLKNLGEHNNA